MDINELRQSIESILSRHKRFKIEQNDGKYTILSKDARLEVVIDPKWIGYDLSISDAMLGREIGEFLDTDNYPIDGQYKKVSLEIFAEVVECLKGFLEHRIYAGTQDGKYILAVPISESKYEVRFFKPRSRWWQLFESSEKAIVMEHDLKSLGNLRPAS